MPQQMSSTSAGSRFDFSITCFSRAYTMKSSWVSLKPPLKALAKGVRIARVITTSSAFLEVLVLLVNEGDAAWQRSLHGTQTGRTRSDLSEDRAKSFGSHCKDWKLNTGCFQEWRNRNWGRRGVLREELREPLEKMPRFGAGPIGRDPSHVE